MKLSLIVLLALTAPAFARIGETKAQIEKRYGIGTEIKGAGMMPGQIEYKKDGYFITIIYGKNITRNGVSAEGRCISETYRATLLEANKGTSKWGEPKEATHMGQSCIEWSSEDRTRVARFFVGTFNQCLQVQWVEVPQKPTGF
jgi:hypothetical protein